MENTMKQTQYAIEAADLMGTLVGSVVVDA